MSRIKVVGVLAVVVLAGCQAAALAIPPLLSFAKNMLQTSGQNHGASYVETVEGLLTAFMNVQNKQQQPGQPQPGQPSQPGQPAPPAQSQLNIDVAMVKKSGGQVTSIQDGDTLRGASGDQFKAVLRAHQNCYVYVCMIDATGYVQPLRPGVGGGTTGQANASVEYEVPAGASYYGLDSNQGVETVYFIVTRERNAEIEGLFTDFSTQTRSLKGPPKSTVSQAPVIPKGYKTVKKRAVRTRSSEGDVDAETYFSELGAELVITRWFNHE